MALEAVVFPQDLLGPGKGAGEVWGYDVGGGPEEEKGGGGGGGCVVRKESKVVDGAAGTWDVSSPLPTESTAAGRRKRRRRPRSLKNQEEVENQRMTHIAVERNRRKQMNEYLAVLRSLMPASYSQRGDQASVVGGAINFVKELENLVQSLQVHKRIKQRSPFADFFAFPQYSSRCVAAGEAAGESREASAADIEVTMVESYASLKILARRRPKQLLRLVVGLQDLQLTTLHLNITTLEEMVFYSFSLKVEEQCRLMSVDDIAAAVHAIVRGIQGEAAFD